MKASRLEVGDRFDWFGETATVRAVRPSRLGGPYAVDLAVELEHHEHIVVTYPWRHEVTSLPS